VSLGLHRSLGSTLAVTLAILGLAAPAAAQYVVFPRLGLSAAPDRYEPNIEVHGDDPFDLWVLVLPPEGEAMLGNEYGSFHWAVLEACCGGAARIVAQDYSPLYQHEGDILFGIVSSAQECGSGDVIELCRLTLQMTVDLSGQYFIIAGPLSLAYTCNLDGVVMTDMMVYVTYVADTTPVEPSSWSEVKSLFR